MGIVGPVSLAQAKALVADTPQVTGHGFLPPLPGLYRVGIYPHIPA